MRYTKALTTQDISKRKHTRHDNRKRKQKNLFWLSESLDPVQPGALLSPFRGALGAGDTQRAQPGVLLSQRWTD